MKPQNILHLLLLWLPLGLLAQVDDLPPPDPNAFVLVEKEPVPLNLNELKKEIGYPPLAKESEIQGKVIIRILLDEKGQYMRHIVIKDPHPILTKAVESKISILRFTPGISGGKPIKVWVTIPFDFKLLGGNSDPSGNRPTNTTYFKLEDALQNPANVEVLYLQGQNLKAFPMEVLQFPNLRRLELGDNQIPSIPGEISQLRNLQFLALPSNQLTGLPEEIWLLPQLRGLKLDGNQFPKKVQKQLSGDHLHILFPKDDKGRMQW